jgi:hypothetical protein
MREGQSNYGQMRKYPGCTALVRKASIWAACRFRAAHHSVNNCAAATSAGTPRRIPKYSDVGSTLKSFRKIIPDSGSHATLISLILAGLRRASADRSSINLDALAFVSRLSIPTIT